MVAEVSFHGSCYVAVQLEASADFVDLYLFFLNLQNASKRKRKHEKDGKSSKKKDFKF
jgi:hypothetical protein